MKTLLFAYGRLKHNYSPPATMWHHVADEVRGEMFLRQRADDPAMISIGSAFAPWVRGEVITIDTSELSELDRQETGYNRIRATTKGRREVWIFEWNGSVPSRRDNLTVWEAKQ